MGIFIRRERCGNIENQRHLIGNDFNKKMTHLGSSILFNLSIILGGVGSYLIVNCFQKTFVVDDKWKFFQLGGGIIALFFAKKMMQCSLNFREKEEFLDALYYCVSYQKEMGRHKEALNLLQYKDLIEMTPRELKRFKELEESIRRSIILERII